MRKVTLLAAAFAAMASATTLVAQRAGGPPPGGRGGGRGGPGMMMDRMLLEGITLTDAQKSQLEALHKADRDKMEAQRGQGGGRGDFDAVREAREKGDTATANRLMAEQRAKMDTRRDEQVASIRAILSSDQLAKFDENVATMKKRESEGRGRMGGMGRGGRPPGL